MEITNRLDGKVLFEADVASMKLAVEAAIAASANLRHANLCGVDLCGANLREANLCSANLRYANLRYANLSCANLSGADLRYANLRGASLQQCIGLVFSQLSFSGHGECRRMLTAVVIGADTVYFCGCFKGSYNDLEKYIEGGDPELKESRRVAARCVKMTLELSIEKKGE